MGEGPDIKTVAAATYAATADHFDDPALSFWDRYGRRTVDRIGLRPGDRVLVFLPDMAVAVAELWRLVRPGGVLAVTVWGPRFLEPASTTFLAAVGAERPDLVDTFHPWTRITDGAALSRLFQETGATAPTVAAEPGTQPLADPEDWWTIVLGTGYRATVQQLDPAAARRVRAANAEWLREHEVGDLGTNVVYAQCRKPGSAS